MDDFAAKKLIEILREKNLTLATAESCTGGNIAHSVTVNAGCSDVYLGGVVSYANEVKTSLLGVSPAVIASQGVVSEPVVEQMAAGVCRAIGADCSVATSGIAGPGGAVPGKPVGTVCIGVAIKNTDASANESFKTQSRTFHFHGSRVEVIQSATSAAFAMLAALINQ